VKHENFSLSSEIFLGFSVVKHEIFWGFLLPAWWWLIRWLGLPDLGVVVVDSVVGLIRWLIRWWLIRRRREPPQPAAVACRARSLPVWRSPTAKPAAWGCRAHRNEFCKTQRCWNFCLFGCCEKLIWVGVGYFWWKVIIKKYCSKISRYFSIFSYQLLLQSSSKLDSRFQLKTKAEVTED
jgi:hypothetical protein